MAIDALLRVGGRGAAIAIRVVRTSPDQMNQFGDGRFLSETIIFNVPVSMAPDLAIDDEIEIDGEVFRIRADPKRDSERLFWMAEMDAT